jgi:hypothetical protein
LLLLLLLLLLPVRPPEDAIKAAVKDIKAKRGKGSESHSDSEGHKAEATA